MDDNGCETKKRQKSPDKKSITASVGSYASVLKGREKNKMSGKNGTDRKHHLKLPLLFVCFIKLTRSLSSSIHKIP